VSWNAERARKAFPLLRATRAFLLADSISKPRARQHEIAWVRQPQVPFVRSSARAGTSFCSTASYFPVMLPPGLTPVGLPPFPSAARRTSPLVCRNLVAGCRNSAPCRVIVGFVRRTSIYFFCEVRLAPENGRILRALDKA
jgi:hypothetical protein